MRKPLRLEGFLPYRLSVLSNTVSGAIATRYADAYELSIPQWRVMMVLAEYPGSSADEVRGRTEIDKGTVSRAVAALIERGYVGREFAAEDRRRSILTLTRRGRAAYDEVVPFAEACERHLLEGLSEGEVQALDRLLERLLERARRLKADLAGE